MASRYPLHMYHQTKMPVYALNQKDEEEHAKDGYGERYIKQDYPRCIYHSTGDVKLVKSAEEEFQYIGDEAKHRGWQSKPYPPKEVAEEGETPVAKGKPTKREIEQVQLLNDLQFEVELQKDKITKLEALIEETRESMRELVEIVEALTPKKAKKEAEKAAS